MVLMQARLLSSGGAVNSVLQDRIFSLCDANIISDILNDPI